MVEKTTKSLCPSCGRVLEARIYDQDGKVWIERECPVHGRIRSLYWSDVAMFDRFEGYALERLLAFWSFCQNFGQRLVFPALFFGFRGGQRLFRLGCHN